MPIVPVADNVMSPMPGFKAYVATDSGATVDEVFARCNRDMYAGYGPTTRGQAARPVAYPLAAYRQLIASLAGMPHIECVTLGALCQRPADKDRVRLAIRHDVDGDIVTALFGARIEASFGVPSSYYFLHTAFYYGRFEGQRFLRHGCMAHVYRAVQSLGHEIGLHTNGLEVYQANGLDGAQAIATEIAWLREGGLKVVGTVGHGSKAVYGAENFELFQGRAKGKARTDTALQEAEEITHGGQKAWVHVLNEASLGLAYEGNDIFWQKATRVEYGATRTVDGWRWNRRFNRDAPGPLAFCSQEAMLADIARLEPGCCVVLTVHPCYYGFRHRGDACPSLHLDRQSRVVNAELGWHTWVPRSLVAVHEDHDDPREERQSFASTNELGMIGSSPAISPERLCTKRRVLVLDGDAFADPSMVRESSACSLAEVAMNALEPSASSWLLLSHPGMGASRLFGWLEQALHRFRPTDIILGIGTRELAWSMPSLWSQTTGLSAHYPAGDCLVPKARGEAEIRKAVTGWIVRQRDPKPLDFWPQTDVALCQTMCVRRLPKIDGIDADEFVRACLREYGESASRHDAKLYLAMSDRGPAWQDATLLEAYRSRVQSWASESGATVIDPTHAFERVAKAGTPVVRATGGLSVDAHRALGRCLADVVSQNYTVHA